MKNLKNMRLEKGLSQQKLADYIGISQQSVYKYENDISEPDITTLKKLADFFETSVDFLTDNTNISKKYDNYVVESLNNEELNVVRLYRKLPAARREIIRQIITEFLN